VQLGLQIPLRDLVANLARELHELARRARSGTRHLMEIAKASAGPSAGAFFPWMPDSLARTRSYFFFTFGIQHVA
jgi:hypothetical protein